MINKPNKIVIHCSDSPHGRGDTAEDIHLWHKQRGWDGIGYHYVICEDGLVEAGRPTFWMPAHAKGHNEDSLAICLIGIDKFTDEQFHNLALLVENLMLKYNISKKNVMGHCDLDDNKTCPNFSVKDFMYTRLG